MVQFCAMAAWCLERFPGTPSERFGIVSSGHEAVMRYFRRVWPEQKEGSKGWLEEWESWGPESKSRDRVVSVKSRVVLYGHGYH